MRALFFGRWGCGATEQALTHLNSLGLQTTFITSRGRGEPMPEETESWRGEFIFCFRSFFILRKNLIDRAAVAAVNFHPAPVEYPGSGCVNFALYDGADRYGVTAHLINEKIDNGPVIECRRFPILPNDSVDTLLARTHIKMLDLFFDVTTELTLGGCRALDAMVAKSGSERWVGDARTVKDLERLKNIPPDATEEEMKRRIRATYTEKFPPSIRIHGLEFAFKPPALAPHRER